MKQKKWTFLILLFAIIFSSFSIKEVSAAAIEDCHYDTPIPMKGGSYDWSVIDPFLTAQGIKKKTSKGGLNLVNLYYRHIVSYGSAFGTKDSTKICTEAVSGGISIYRYMGYNEDGVQIPDWNKLPDQGGGTNWVQSRKLIRHAWNVADVRAHSSFPSKVESYGSNVTQQYADLDKAIDSFAPTKNGGRGYFVEPHKYWCSVGGKLTLVGSGCKGNGVTLTGKNLAEFAVMVSKPHKFSSGSFYLYQRDGDGKVWYGGFYIPGEDPFEAVSYDASTDLDIPKTKLTSEVIKGEIRFDLKGSDTAPLSISAPCDATKKKGFMQCASVNAVAGIRIMHESGEKVFEKEIKFSQLKQNGAKPYTLKLEDFNIIPTKSGKYKVLAWLPHYKDTAGVPEKNLVNNKEEIEITVIVNQNASVEIEGTSNYSVADTLTNIVTVNNDTKGKLSGPLTVQILDKDKKLVKTLPNKTFSNLAIGGDFEYDIGTAAVTLPLGDYFIYAKIKHYTELPENDYTDNEAYFPITIGPFIPENTECNFLETKYIKVITNPSFPKVKPGVSRACVGWAPNFPSTRIEGGQGTYFYVAYKILPTPMPAYKVTTLDRFGIKQTLEREEPLDKLGACDYTIVNDKECRMYEPFMYYPSKWESRFGTEELKDFRGPYTAGPHDFYHYMYRGRMVPHEIDFNFKIIDMKKNANIPLANGTISYDVPDECYLKDVIDIKEECRLIQFYVPINKEDYAKNNPLTLPEDAAVLGIPKEKIQFLNPGEHTFRVEIDENQMYLYQNDLGAEWQGKDGIYREKWNGETTTYPNKAVKTYTTKGTAPKEWVNQDTYKNHCYSNEDAFSDTGQWDKLKNDFKEKDSPVLECFHNHSDNFHYWKFEWSKVKKFGKDGFIK